MDNKITRESIKLTIKNFTKGTTIGLIDIDKNVHLFANKLNFEKVSSLVSKTTHSDNELIYYNYVLSLMMETFSTRCVINSFAFAKLLDAEKISIMQNNRKVLHAIYYGVSIGNYCKQLWQDTFYSNGELINGFEKTHESMLQSQDGINVEVLNGQIVIYSFLQEMQKDQCGRIITQSFDLQPSKMIAICNFCSALKGNYVPQLTIIGNNK